MFNIIDIENWERKEHYYHYSNVNLLSYDDIFNIKDCK